MFGTILVEMYILASDTFSYWYGTVSIKINGILEQTSTPISLPNRYDNITKTGTIAVAAGDIITVSYIPTSGMVLIIELG